MATEGSRFPKFVDGDVLINLSSSRTYYLHSGVLRRNSTILAKLLDDSHAAVLSSKAKKEGVTMRFRLDLTGVSGNAPGRFVKRVSSSRGRVAGRKHEAPVLMIRRWWIGRGFQRAYPR